MGASSRLPRASSCPASTASASRSTAASTWRPSRPTTPSCPSSVTWPRTSATSATRCKHSAELCRWLYELAHDLELGYMAHAVGLALPRGRGNGGGCGRSGGGCALEVCATACFSLERVGDDYSMWLREGEGALRSEPRAGCPS